MTSAIRRVELESFRFAAVKLFATGASQSTVAHRFGVSRTTAMRWHARYEAEDDMRARKAKGRSFVIDRDKIRTMLLSPRYQTDRHTTATIAVDIEREFGVLYDRDHVCRILKSLGIRKLGGRWT